MRNKKLVNRLLALILAACVSLSSGTFSYAADTRINVGGVISGGDLELSEDIEIKPIESLEMMEKETEEVASTESDVTEATTESTTETTTTESKEESSTDEEGIEEIVEEIVEETTQSTTESQTTEEALADETTEVETETETEIVTEEERPEQPAKPTSEARKLKLLVTDVDIQTRSSQMQMNWGNYKVGEVTWDEEKGCYTSIVTVYPDKYVERFNNTYGKYAEYVYDKETNGEDFTIPFVYTPNKYGTYIWSVDREGYITGIRGVRMYVKDKTKITCTVTYTDGLDDIELFADQTNTVSYGTQTPAFEGPTENDSYLFLGWNPEIAETVTADITYTAQWVKIPTAPGASSTNVTNELITFRCVSDHENHPDYVLNWFGSHVVYNQDMTWDAQRGVFTCTATVKMPVIVSSVLNKQWGKTTHYYDKSKTYTINLVWDENKTGLNSQGKEVTGLWLPDGEQIIEVYCYTKPSAPSDAVIQKLGKVLWIRDNTNLKQYIKPYFATGSYEVSEVTGSRAEGFYCTLTVKDFSPYLDTFNAKYTDTRYVIDEEATTADFSYTLKYTGSTTDYKQDGTGWTVDTTGWSNQDKLNGKQLLLKPVTYEITYVDGLDGTAFASQTFTQKERYETPDFAGEPQREGYEFAGWSPEIAPTVTSDATYTATWVPKEYTIIVDEANGKDTYEIVVTYEGTLADYLPEEPIRTGYTFAGWTDENGMPVDATVSYREGSLTTVSATWTANTYQIRFRSAGGTWVRPITVTYDAPVGKLNKPFRLFYKFEGWYDNEGNLVTEDTIYQTAGDSILVAKWKPIFKIDITIGKIHIHN